MYRLTPRMTQRLWRYLQDYHKLFDGGRCLGWELEELIVKSIKDDTSAQHQVFWTEGGHDDKADIKVVSDKTYLIQIKSGKFNNKEDQLSLSGYRMGRFKGDLSQITNYLNNLPAEMLAVPYSKIDGVKGREHTYQICYIDKKHLQDLSDNWAQRTGKGGA